MQNKLETFGADIQLATAAIAPQNIKAELVKFARSELSLLIQSGEGSPEYDRYVNGRLGASESDVVLPGPIVYDFIWWRDILEFALQFAVERSPEKSGDYKRAWFLMADGVPVASPRQIGRAATVLLVNNQPYHRKIDVGFMKMSVPPGIVEDTRMAVNRIWGNRITAKRTLVQLPGGYVLKGHFRRGIRPKARAKLQRDTKTGAIMTYPALKLEMRR